MELSFFWDPMLGACICIGLLFCIYFWWRMDIWYIPSCWVPFQFHLHAWMGTNNPGIFFHICMQRLVCGIAHASLFFYLVLFWVPLIINAMLIWLKLKFSIGMLEYSDCISNLHIIICISNYYWIVLTMIKPCIHVYTIWLENNKWYKFINFITKYGEDSDHSILTCE